MAHYTVNTAKAREGKHNEAKEAALALAKYVNETYGGNVQILVNHAGNRNTFHWVSYHESWAAAEERRKKQMDDAKFHELSEKVREAIDLYNSEYHHYEVVK